MANKPTERQMGVVKSSSGKPVNVREAAAEAQRKFNEKAKKAEDALQAKMKNANVKDLNAVRKQIAKKTGIWPNGMTN